MNKYSQNNKLKILLTGSNGQLGHDFQKLFSNSNIKYISTDYQELNIIDSNELENFFKNNNEIQHNMLVDCLTNMVTNIIFEERNIDWDNFDKNLYVQIVEKLNKNVENSVNELLKVSQNFENVIIVSNELGMGLVPSYPLGRYFREIAGKMNQIVAEKADEVYFVVSGISMKIK